MGVGKSQSETPQVCLSGSVIKEGHKESSKSQHNRVLFSSLPCDKAKWFNKTNLQSQEVKQADRRLPI